MDLPLEYDWDNEPNNWINCSTSQGYGITDFINENWEQEADENDAQGHYDIHFFAHSLLLVK